MPTAEELENGMISETAYDNFMAYGCTAALQEFTEKLAVLRQTLDKKEITPDDFERQEQQLIQDLEDQCVDNARLALIGYGFGRMWELCTDNGITPYHFDYDLHLVTIGNFHSFQMWRFCKRALN